MAKKKKARKTKEKKEKKPKKRKHAHTRYEVSGDSVKRKNRTCPKCGKGVFLAEHKDRTTCGQCGFTEFKSK
ncbi:30S ribosomal protein S27ae [Candidatus Woesearchaeota archaeon]|nr:30S ribosomal protein S27ae [Candidatus Woesearchaeota archaeon]